jgi:hypothetical protein
LGGRDSGNPGGMMGMPGVLANMTKA